MIFTKSRIQSNIKKADEEALADKNVYVAERTHWVVGPYKIGACCSGCFGYHTFYKDIDSNQTCQYSDEAIYYLLNQEGLSHPHFDGNHKTEVLSLTYPR